MSYLVLTATFSAFLIFGGPSGWVVRKIGYKKSLILALSASHSWNTFCKGSKANFIIQY